MLRTALCSSALLVALPAFGSPAILLSAGGASTARVIRTAVFRQNGTRSAVFQVEGGSKGGAWALAVGVSPGVQVDQVWNALFPVLDEATAPWLEARLCDGSNARRVSTASAVASAKQNAPAAIALFASPAAAETTLAAWGLSSAQWGAFSVVASKANLLVMRFDATSAASAQTVPLRLFEKAPIWDVPAVQMFGDVGELHSWSFGELPVVWDSLIEHRASDSRIKPGSDPLASYRGFIDAESSAHIEARDYFSVGLRPSGWPAEVPVLYDAIAKRAGPLTAECASALAKPPCAPGELFATSSVSCEVPSSCAPYREAAWFGDGYVTRAVLNSADAATAAREYASAIDVIPLVPAADCPVAPVGPASPSAPRTPSEQGPDEPVSDPGGDAVGSAACGACLSVAEAGAADGCGSSDPGEEDPGACTGDSSADDTSSCSKDSGHEDCRASRSKRKQSYLSRFSLALAAVALGLRRRFRPARGPS